MNSKHILIILLVQISSFGYSQNLSTAVRQDFCKNAIENYYYGRKSFRSLMNISAKKIGLDTPLKIEKAVEDLCSNIKLQDEFFKNLNEASKGLDKEQYISIGMNPKNVDILYDYVITKYQSNANHIKDDEITKSETIDDFVKDTAVINKTKLLKSIYPKSNFLNDSLILRKELVIKIKGGSEDIEFKSTILKEYTYINEIEDEERINIIILSKTDEGLGYFNLLTMKQLKDKSFQSVGRPKRINIESEKLKNNLFKTIKESGHTYFTIWYTNESNEKIIDYYDINLNFIKTVLESNQIQIKNIESKANEYATLKDIFQRNGTTYISLNIVELKYTIENEYKIVNQNSKTKTFELSNNTKITDKNCKTIDNIDYLSKNKETFITKKDDQFCMFSSIDGIITVINLGCWN